MEQVEQRWRKSTYSGNDGAANCVETSQSTDGRILARDTKEHRLKDGRTVLAVSPKAWRTFVKALC